MGRESLRAHLTGTLPRAIRGSALVVLYSAFESTVLEFSRSLSIDLQRPNFSPIAKRGAFPRQASRHFEEVFDVRLFSDESESSAIDDLRTLRNSIVHQQCSFARLPARIRDSIVSSKSRLKVCQEFEGTWIPSIECVRAHGELIRTWARLLSSRVFERVGLDSYL